jgi:thiol-disulfide isomerase/thioredoxin
MKILYSFLVILALLFTSCKNNPDNNTPEESQEQSSGDGNTTPGVSKNPNDTTNKNSPSGGSLYNPNSTVSGTAPVRDGQGNIQFPTPTSFLLEGTVLNGSGQTVILDRMKIGSVEPLLSQPINAEGRFDLDGQVEYPDLFQLRIGHDVIHVPVHPNDHMVFTFDMKDVNKFKVTGSMEPVWLRQMYEILERSNGRLSKARDKLEELRTKNVAQYLKMNDTLPTHYRRLRKIRNSELKAFIDKIDTSFTALLASLRLDPEYDIEFMEKMDRKMVRLYPKSPFYAALHEKVVAYAPIAVGRMAPEIMSMTPQGKTQRLSTLKGKYVLVDFWASWCAPCKEEIPKLKEIYKRYKNKNFEILSVSLDNEKAAWLTGIAKEDMPWLHVSDLEGFSSASARTYLITAIPATFLIGPDGKIIDRDFRANELSERLKKLIF